MAQFTPSKKTAQDFNGGIEYVDGLGDIEGDAVHAESINNVIEGFLYAQNTADYAKQIAQSALEQVNHVLADKTLLPDVQKNLYNLGAFDIFVSNSDGTGTVPRKTGFIYDYSQIKRVYDGTASGGRYHIVTQIAPVTVDTIKSNAKIDLDGWRKPPSDECIIWIDASRIVISPAQNKTLKQTFEEGLIIQYQLPKEYQYTEQVIENQPIRPANQEEELYWHEEWRKGLNLYKGSQSFQEGFNTLFKEKELPIGTYTIFFQGEAQGQIVGGGIKQADNVYAGANAYTTFIVKDSTEIRIWFNDTTAHDMAVTRGAIPYPYEPYYGGIVREKDLSGAQLFPEDVNPAQTIGGDWEDKGTVTTSDNTVFHAYRRLS